MAFFKFRQRGQPEPEAGGRARGRATPAAAPQETIDALRRRARHRLVGAAVLVLLAVIGFPLLFDTQPRPVAVDVPITIPDKDKVAPLRIPEPVSTDASLGEREEVVTARTAPAPAAEPRASERPATPTREARSGDAEARAQADEAGRAKARADEAAKAQARTDERSKAQAEAQSRRDEEARARREAEQRAKREEAARARGLLEGRGGDKSPAASADGKGERFIVQVGAFAEDAAAREARQKAERAGVRTYTQVVETKDGKRTRVRVGPFASREEAERAAATLKKAGLPGSVLSL